MSVESIKIKCHLIYLLCFSFYLKEVHSRICLEKTGYIRFFRKIPNVCHQSWKLVCMSIVCVCVCVCVNRGKKRGKKKFERKSYHTESKKAFHERKK